MFSSSHSQTISSEEKVSAQQGLTQDVEIEDLVAGGPKQTMLAFSIKDTKAVGEFLKKNVKDNLISVTVSTNLSSSTEYKKEIEMTVKVEKIEVEYNTGKQSVDCLVFRRSGKGLKAVTSMAYGGLALAICTGVLAHTENNYNLAMDIAADFQVVRDFVNGNYIKKTIEQTKAPSNTLTSSSSSAS